MNYVTYARIRVCSIWQAVCWNLEKLTFPGRVWAIGWWGRVGHVRPAVAQPLSRPHLHKAVPSLPQSGLEAEGGRSISQQPALPELAALPLAVHRLEWVSELEWDSGEWGGCGCALGGGELWRLMPGCNLDLNTYHSILTLVPRTKTRFTFGRFSLTLGMWGCVWDQEKVKILYQEMVWNGEKIGEIFLHLWEGREGGWCHKNWSEKSWPESGYRNIDNQCRDPMNNDKLEWDD